MCDENRHVWAWAASTTGGKVPEGTPCQCGSMEVHYELCPTCNKERIVPKENRWNQDYTAKDFNVDKPDIVKGQRFFYDYETDEIYCVKNSMQTKGE